MYEFANWALKPSICQLQKMTGSEPPPLPATVLRLQFFELSGGCIRKTEGGGLIVENEKVQYLMGSES